MKVSADEVHEFLAGVLVFEERAGEFGSGGHGVLFLDAAHRHAEVLGLDDHAHSEGIQHFLEAVLDLGGESLLKLQPEETSERLRTVISLKSTSPPALSTSD